MLAPSDSDESSEESDPGEEDLQYDEIQRHLEKFENLEEPLRSRAFIGLQKLAYHRQCMQARRCSKSGRPVFPTEVEAIVGVEKPCIIDTLDTCLQL